MARLVIFDEAVRGVDLGGHAVILGRSRRADIPIHDGLLSRKHCAIVPTGGAGGGNRASGFRLIDLKSSNGTFVNGARIDRRDLSFDDIVEIGNTVIVLLDTDTYHRGEGLPRLNNPSKARELIRAIKRREVQARDGRSENFHRPGGGSGPARALRQKKALTPSETEFLRWARRELASNPALRQLMEAYLAHRIASLVVRHSGDLGRVLSSAVERILRREHFEGDLEGLRAVISRTLGEVLVMEREAEAEEGSASRNDAQRGELEEQGGRGEGGAIGGGTP